MSRLECVGKSSKQVQHEQESSQMSPACIETPGSQGHVTVVSETVEEKPTTDYPRKSQGSVKAVSHSMKNCPPVGQTVLSAGEPASQISRESRAGIGRNAGATVFFNQVSNRNNNSSSKLSQSLTSAAVLTPSLESEDGHADKKGDRTEVEGDRTEEEGDRTEEEEDHREEEGDCTEEEGDRTEEEGDRTEEEGDRTEVEGDRTEVEGDRTEEEEDRTEEEEQDEGHQAPLELMAEFLKSVMEKDYLLANKLCQMILIYEPENPEATQFLLLIQEQLLTEQAADQSEEEEEDSNSSDEEDSEDSGSEETSAQSTSSSSSSSSSSEEDEKQDEKQGRRHKPCPPSHLPP